MCERGRCVVEVTIAIAVTVAVASIAIRRERMGRIKQAHGGFIGSGRGYGPEKRMICEATVEHWTKTRISREQYGARQEGMQMSE